MCKEIYDLIAKELYRQQSTIELIASENFTSKAVMLAQGSILTNKYAEGYINKRYYGGCEFIDEVESLAIDKVKKLFKCNYANVQPHSGSQANQAVFLALLKPGDTILAMDLNSGGHLTHGANPNLSGKFFNAVHYCVNKDSYLIDYNEVEMLAQQHKPKLIIVGYSAYSRKINFATFKEIADKVGAYLLADIAHIAGLVATEYHSSPIPYAHVVTSTTHKTLRGPRGGLILTNDESISKKINSAVFPGMQGGPLMHVIAAKAIAFSEALMPQYKEYINQVMLNAKVLAKLLQDRGYNILTGGTDNHMLLVDLRGKNITGQEAEYLLDAAGITCNKQVMPFDTTSPTITSGIRLGTPACTTRGFKENDFITVGKYIADILDNIAIIKSAKKNEDITITEIENSLDSVITHTKQHVQELCNSFPIYTN
ncbi:serine hydroxymethyltransferase [Orientia tsutsugamushi]|uniref:Serine hydroxymethyltransferase n=1 Tax=Orientia tsutsugamushi TaxID=784 RepID=A0A2U3QSZ0_ORITS|nr:serine hydroxymethyltransferase [Orientia tsutsugamushi]KJV54919.1 serine hydroxymethyltransferase 2 [Orientia tsutsugamushi str. Kato PP]SPR04078.1 serine hydroxymethyltransferase [Orientia tsutsugamushi]